MEQSLFIEYIDRLFPGIVLDVVERLNGTENVQPFYHRRMLTKKYSHSGKWESIAAEYGIVAADIIAMDSQIALKKRDSMGSASGDIPKVGLKMMLNENELTKLETLRGMVALGQNQDSAIRQIINKIFEDTPRVIQGVYERNEATFLEALSTGMSVIDSNNVGAGIRVDFGYKDANKFGVTALWSNPTTAKPLNDIQAVRQAARTAGHILRMIKMDLVTFEDMANTDQMKQQFGFFLIPGGSASPVAPDLEQTNNLLTRRFGLTIEIIERTVVTEKDGVRTSHSPWSEGKVIFMTSDNAGDLVYSFIAEMMHPVAGVAYQTADEMILVSKYRKNEPLTEFTSSQARVLPVLANVNQIYQLDAKVVNE